MRAGRVLDRRPAPPLRELGRRVGVRRRADGPALHHVDQRERAERRHAHVVELDRLRLARALLELLAGAVEPVGPERGAPEVRVHERLAGVVGPAAVDGGLGQQLVGRAERGVEVALEARALQARQRHRLQVAAAALGRQPVGGLARVREMLLGGLGVPGLEGGARERRGQLGVAAQPLGRQRVDQRADRVALAAHEQREPVLGDELDGEVPVLRGDGVTQRLRPHPALGVPARRAVVQPRQLGAQLAPRAHPQQLREQAVVAVPLASRVDGQDEPVGAFELGQNVAARTLVGQRVRELAADPVDDRRAQEEGAQLRRLAVEHLGEQIVADDAIVAGELGDEALGVVAALQAQRGQPQPGAPALGPRAQRRDQLGSQRPDRAPRAAPPPRPR